MDEKFLAVLWLLLPGLVTAWIFYGLTAHARLDQFERLVQALIYTALDRGILIFTHGICSCLGSGLSHIERWVASRFAWQWIDMISPKQWTPDIDVSVSLAIAVGLGIVLSYFANNSKLHSLFTKWHISKKTSWPTNWYGILHTSERFVVLHLKDGRRIRGLPDFFPDYSDKDHFVLDHPAWMDGNNNATELVETYRLMVPASDVAWVEIMKFQYEVGQTPPVVKSNCKENCDGR